MTTDHIPDATKMVPEALRLADALEQQAWPDVAGIGRDSEHPRAVVLYLRHEPSDEHLRTIQEALRTRPAQPAVGEGDEQ